ncbi:mitochondrial fission regulator 2 [Geospiza fortis]|uniref:Mitochondrial fission regulator n=1 Tax=Geospiza fortis TaxID=48883 RepID=A0A8N5EPF4_GEOFO|nr:mitochondrial fission regulator 2 [Geospiza fortis]
MDPADMAAWLGGGREGRHRGRWGGFRALLARSQAAFFETHVFGSSISRTLGTCLPSAVSSGGHLQQLYAVIRKYQAKVTSVSQKKEYGSTRSVVRRLRTELRRKEKSTGPPDPYLHLDSIQRIPKNSAQKVGVDQAAFQKISALEDELTFLRAQIAAIVSVQTLGSIPSQAFKTLSTADGFYPLPAMTSTPLSVSRNHFVIPSPPPLPSGAPSAVDASNSALELIKQRRAARNSDSAAANSTDHQRTKNFPCMMDVLKDLNKVQLRAVERSPGGTPLSRPKKMQSSDWDPVAVLTHALKQKFAHKNYDEDDSLDKENNSFDSSPFSSPEMPVVGRCSLKPNAKPSLTRTDGVKQVPAWKARAQI